VSALGEHPTDVPATGRPATGRPATGKPALGDRRLVARAGLALVLANARYWTSVAPVVRARLRYWERRARAIEDSGLRELALEKLHGEGFHAEAAAILATLAPKAHRRDAAEAMVALELLFDYLDGLTERPSLDPLAEGERLFESYIDVFAADDAARARVDDHDEYQHAPSDTDRDGPPARADGHAEYLQALSDAARAAFERLPAAGAVAAVARASARRAARAQTRMHAAGQLGIAQAREWARAEAAGTDLNWRELLAGAASSVLTTHALIAAAADPKTTPREAAEVESAYLSTCVLLTLLDGLVDHEQDTPGPSYVGLYGDHEELARTLARAAASAAAQARALRDGPRHAMTLVGVVAYYISAPGARREPAKAICGRLRRQLEPLVSPTLWVMRAWRSARRRRDRRQPATEVEQRASIVYGEGTPTGGMR
jgi:tetraprenyl-beta-curcumene synthase